MCNQAKLQHGITKKKVFTKPPMNAPRLFNFADNGVQEIPFECADKKVNLDQECVGIPAFERKVLETCPVPTNTKDKKTLVEFLNCFCPLLSQLQPKVIECVLNQCQSITLKEIQESFDLYYKISGCDLKKNLAENVDSETNRPLGSSATSSTESSTDATVGSLAPTNTEFSNGAKHFGVLSLFFMFLMYQLFSLIFISPLKLNKCR